MHAVDMNKQTTVLTHVYLHKSLYVYWREREVERREKVEIITLNKGNASGWKIIKGRAIIGSQKPLLRKVHYESHADVYASVKFSLPFTVVYRSIDQRQEKIYMTLWLYTTLWLSLVPATRRQPLITRNLLRRDRTHTWKPLFECTYTTRPCAQALATVVQIPPLPRAGGFCRPPAFTDEMLSLEASTELYRHSK